MITGFTEVYRILALWCLFFFVQVDAFVKIFPGVSHGWSVRYNDEDEVAVKSAEDSHQDMLGWLEKHLK